ncbi:MAG: asparaginase [Alphaproteobacteria bacterium]|nr:asparaginase [Alphaproteobacteria bacterium]
MSLPRVSILALGGTIATRRDATGAMQMGLGADDLVAAVPGLAGIATIRAETLSRVGSHSLSIAQIRALARRIEADDADAVVVTQGTDTLEETAFLLDLLGESRKPLVVTAAMRNPALASADGPGNLLAAVRLAVDPWVRERPAALGPLVVLLDQVHAAADVVKAHPVRIDAFTSPQTGPLAVFVEGRVVPLAFPVRAAMERTRAMLGPRRRDSESHAPVALLWLGLDDDGALVEAMLRAPDLLGYRGAVIAAMGGGHAPESMASRLGRLAKALPTVVAARSGGGPMLRETYAGPSAEIELRRAGLIWGGRLHPLKARLLLSTALDCDVPPRRLPELFDAWG